VNMALNLGSSFQILSSQNCSVSTVAACCVTVPRRELVQKYILKSKERLCPGGRLSASEEGLCSMQLVSKVSHELSCCTIRCSSAGTDDEAVLYVCLVNLRFAKHVGDKKLPIERNLW
jgi:hypothetical protein